MILVRLTNSKHTKTNIILDKKHKNNVFRSMLFFFFHSFSQQNMLENVMNGYVITFSSIFSWLKLLWKLPTRSFPSKWVRIQPKMRTEMLVHCLQPSLFHYYNGMIYNYGLCHSVMHTLRLLRNISFSPSIASRTCGLRTCISYLHRQSLSLCLIICGKVFITWE